MYVSINWQKSIAFGICMAVVLCILVSTSGYAMIDENDDIFTIRAKEALSKEIALVEEISSYTLVENSLESLTSNSVDTEHWIDSDDWAMLANQMSSQLDEITYANDFYDIFLISLKGNILYTTARESDLGRNLEDPSLENQGIYEVWHSVRRGNLSVSYVEPYSPSNGLYSIFLAYAVFNDNNEVCGVFAVQIAFEELLAEIYKEEIDFEVRHAEIFNKKVIDEISNEYLFEVKSTHGVQYFLLGASPTNGEPVGTGYDVGILSRSKPVENTTRICSKWVQFGIPENEPNSTYVTSIYYHVWVKSWDNWLELGVDRDGGYSMDVSDTAYLTMSDTASKDHNGGFFLSTGILTIDAEEVRLDTIDLKIKAVDRVPVVFSGSSMISYIIANPESDGILRFRDSDADGLTDYSEMFETHTDPYDNDTDNDQIIDCEEMETDPNLFDTDFDGEMDSTDKEPLISSFERMSGTQYIDGTETISGNYLVDDSIVVKNGGELSIIDSNLFFGSGDAVQSIIVERGGSLSIRNTTIMMGSALDWFANVNTWLNWTEWDHIDIHGDVIVEDSIIRCASMFNVTDSNKCDIQRSSFTDTFYAISLQHTDGRIYDVNIETASGYGLFLVESDSVIEKTDVFVPVGSALYCSNSSPIITNTNLKSLKDVVLKNQSHPVFQNVTYKEVDLNDDKSSIEFMRDVTSDSKKWWVFPAIFVLSKSIIALIVIIRLRSNTTV